MQYSEYRSVSSIKNMMIIINFIIILFEASIILFSTKYDIVKYIPLPGTRGIRLAINVEVTGVFNTLAIISEYIVIPIEDKKKAPGSEVPFALKKINITQPITPPILAAINFFPFKLKSIPKANVLPAEANISIKVLFIIHLRILK